MLENKVFVGYVATIPTWVPDVKGCVWHDWMLEAWLTRMDAVASTLVGDRRPEEDSGLMGSGFCC